MVLFCLSSPTHARPQKRYLWCLGQEEAYIHKNKIGGAYNKLNQEMILIIVQLSQTINLKQEIEEKICSKKFSSVELLRFLIKQKENVFYSTVDQENLKLISVDRNSIKEVHEQAINLFIDFINSIQAQMPKAGCLVKKIPELQIFFDRTLHTLEDVGIEGLFKNLKNVDKIFDQLQEIKYSTSC
jgi:hypothetical protein